MLVLKLIVLDAVIDPASSDGVFHRGHRTKTRALRRKTGFFRSLSQLSLLIFAPETVLAL